MAIKGLTDKHIKLSMFAAVLHKGTRRIERQGKGRKYHIFGHDLNNYFRLEIRDPLAQQAIRETYPVHPMQPNRAVKTAEGMVEVQSAQDDFLIESLDIFLTSDRPSEAFQTSMKLWGKNKLLQQCDREVIYEEREDYTDNFGSPRSRMKPCKTPCPVAGEEIGVPCSKGCVASGTLSFYIPALLDYGSNKPCKLDVTSFYDFISIQESLEAVKAEFDSILYAPNNFPCPRGSIPLVLRRVKLPINRPEVTTEYKQLGSRKVYQRTGRKSAGTTWAVTLSVNPIWSKGYYAWRQHQQIKALGYEPKPELLQEIGFVEVRPELPGVKEPAQRTIDTPAEPPVLTGVIGEAQFAEIRQFWEAGCKDSWQNEREFLKAAIAHFGVKEFGEIPLSRYEELKAFLLDPPR